MIGMISLADHADLDRRTFWWAGKDLNLRRLTPQVYSLLPLATRAPTQEPRR